MLHPAQNPVDLRTHELAGPDRSQPLVRECVCRAAEQPSEEGPDFGRLEQALAGRVGQCAAVGTGEPTGFAGIRDWKMERNLDGWRRHQRILVLGQEDAGLPRLDRRPAAASPHQRPPAARARL